MDAPTSSDDAAFAIHGRGVGGSRKFRGAFAISILALDLANSIWWMRSRPNIRPFPKKKYAANSRYTLEKGTSFGPSALFVASPPAFRQSQLDQSPVHRPPNLQYPIEYEPKCLSLTGFASSVRYVCCKRFVTPFSTRLSSCALFELLLPFSAASLVCSAST